LFLSDYLAIEKPHIIINVVDVSALERNLYLTLQLLEFEVTIVMALNQMDFAAKKGLHLDIEKLYGVLGVKVVLTVAVTGTGISELLSVVVDEAVKEKKSLPREIVYGKRLRSIFRQLKPLLSPSLRRSPRFTSPGGLQLSC
jgi:ferrous iron transport protein B